MTQAHGGWQPPDPPRGVPPGPNGERPAPPPWQLPVPPPGHRYPTPPHPVPVPPNAAPPLPPPAAPPGYRPPHPAPVPYGAAPQPYGHPAPPPRKVAPPVPVVDPPARRSPLPDLPYLPPPPGPQGKVPWLAMARQVPTGLPLVVQPRAGRWALFYVLPLFLLLVPPTILFATGHWLAALFVLVGVVALYVVGFGFRLFGQVTGGPLLAADREGVWLQAQKWPVRAVQIPWELIEEIRTRRWFVDKVLCVLPRDDRVGKLHGFWGSVDQARTTAFFGAPLTAGVGFGDVPAEEVLRRLHDLAQGRSRVDP